MRRFATASSLSFSAISDFLPIMPAFSNGGHDVCMCFVRGCCRATRIAFQTLRRVAAGRVRQRQCMLCFVKQLVPA